MKNLCDCGSCLDCRIQQKNQAIHELAKSLFKKRYGYLPGNYKTESQVLKGLNEKLEHALKFNNKIASSKSLIRQLQRKVDILATDAAICDEVFLERQQDMYRIEFLTEEIKGIKEIDTTKILTDIRLFTVCKNKNVPDKSYAESICKNVLPGQYKLDCYNMYHN